MATCRPTRPMMPKAKMRMPTIASMSAMPRAREGRLRARLLWVMCLSSNRVVAGARILGHARLIHGRVAHADAAAGGDLDAQLALRGVGMFDLDVHQRLGAHRLAIAVEAHRRGGVAGAVLAGH